MSLGSGQYTVKDQEKCNRMRPKGKLVNGNSNPNKRQGS